MRKRPRENLCEICGHYHKYEEGEMCGVCGHSMPATAAAVHISDFPSEILPEFLYLGSYDNASHPELLKTRCISRVLNTVPSCKNLYEYTFTYHRPQENKRMPFDDAIQFLEKCEKDRARVLVHCMSGKNRSPAIVMAYLMKSKGWKLAQSYQWVKERRPLVEISQEVYQQLQDYEQRIFASCSSSMDNSMPSFLPPSFSVGFSMAPVSNPAIHNTPATPIFSHPPTNVPPQEFTFVAQTSAQDNNDTTMGGS